MWVVKMASVLFGNFQGQLNTFFYDKTPGVARHQLRRDFPEEGDCTYVGQECILVSRKEADSSKRFRIVLVFRTPQDRWAHWAWPLFPMITDMFHMAMCRFVNRPEVKDLRLIDSKLYLVLCMRSFNRGPPMIPHHDYDGEIQISHGEDLGIMSWSRFQQKGKGFCLADYLKCFMDKLGHPLFFYDTLDGCKLVPYQCVVKRQDWEQLKKFFTPAFRLQKAAYRRGNGGTTAPSLVEDVRPHCSSQEPCYAKCLHEETIVKTVVRKTFLELDEDDDEDGPPMRRTRSDGKNDVF